MKINYNFPVDFVIPWVDGNDPEWIDNKYQYEGSQCEGNTVNRYRDWDLLRYLFRGIEKYTPWVNKIHFITCGHLPTWLNVNHSKLNIVNHSDYIPHKFLPTFSSHVIELNMHRIEGLSEHFVYFNDDTFIVDEIQKEYFFSANGLPKQMLKVICLYNYAPEGEFSHIDFNNLGIINRNFSVDIISLFFKIFNWRYGIKNNIRNAILLLSYIYPGFYQGHMPAPFLKTTLKEAWSKEGSYLESVCQNRFRNMKDVNQWLFQYWQLVQGNFEPVNIQGKMKLFSIGQDDSELKYAVKNHKYKLICVNDDMEYIEDIETEKEILKGIFDQIFSEKSKFEYDA